MIELVNVVASKSAISIEEKGTVLNLNKTFKIF